MALLAVPHTAALALVPKLLARGVTVIDLSADYRLQDASAYAEWYGTAHTSPELLPEAVFGLPELDRSRLPGARLVACPGCYPTATTLAALPVLSAGLVTSARIVVDAKSGVSGAGRTASAATHYVTVNEAVTPYKVAAHRHTPEIEQALSTAAGRPMSVVFAPHLVPMTRGLLSTVYLEVAPGLTGAEAVELYRAHYADEPFVFVRDLGDMPSTAEVRGTQPRVDRCRRRRAHEHPDRGVCDRQPGEGRRRAGGAVPERGSWVSRDRGPRPTRTRRLAPVRTLAPGRAS